MLPSFARRALLSSSSPSSTLLLPTIAPLSLFPSPSVHHHASSSGKQPPLIERSPLAPFSTLRPLGASFPLATPSLSSSSPISSFTHLLRRQQRRTIYHFPRTDEYQKELLTPEELRALELKKELLRIIDTTGDFDTQRKAYEELLELQRSHRQLLCNEGEDIFGLPLPKPQGIPDEQNIDGTKPDFTLEPFLLERKPITDQLIVRETMNVGRHIKITEGGRIQSYSCLVICGTGRGAAAYGYGKAKTPAVALQKANLDAEKHMVVVDLWEDRTIPYNIDAYFGGTKLQMRTGREGAGMVCTPVLKRLCEAFGLKDITIKIHGRRNPHAIVKAFFKGMLSFTHPETRARAFGQQTYDHSKIWRNRNPIISYGQLDNILKRLPDQEDDKWLG